MRRNGLGDAGFGAEPFDDSKHHRASHGTAVPVDKRDIFGFGLKRPGGAFLHPVTKPLLRYRRDRDQALLGALSFDEHIVFVEINLTELQVD